MIGHLWGKKWTEQSATQGGNAKVDGIGPGKLYTFAFESANGKNILKENSYAACGIRYRDGQSKERKNRNRE